MQAAIQTVMAQEAKSRLTAAEVALEPLYVFSSGKKLKGRELALCPTGNITVQMARDVYMVYGNEVSRAQRNPLHESLLGGLRRVSRAIEFIIAE